MTEPTLPEERRRRILELLGKSRQLGVAELGALLGVSQETVRRDLRRLDEEGLLRRVHGGAVPVQTTAENPFRERLASMRAEKERIGRYAAGLFGPSDSLMIDTGSTTLLFAEALSARQGLSVVTNSVDIARILAREPGRHEVVLLGGDFDCDTGSALGPFTIEQIARFAVDHVVLTIGAVHAERGFMDFRLDEAMVARAMLQRGAQVTILADHGKFDRSAFARVCGFERPIRLITDAAPRPETARALARQGVEILIAD
ncbi:MAG TPA: DeoR/GlpR transcriptional regulator [Rhodospirillales bacterium]|nr:DeoR/GlpR transcriptional regulator [Rhodospirillales bacterium]